MEENSNAQSYDDTAVLEGDNGVQIKMKDTVVYLLHARTVESQKQPLLSNTHTQQYTNSVMQSVSRQQLGKHISTYQAMLCNVVTSSTIQAVFSMGSVQSAYKISEFRS
jgi:hypothetical protein